MNEGNHVVRRRGKEHTVTDARGNLTLFAYDGFDRLSQMNLPSAAVGAGASDPADYEAYGRDANGNRTAFRRRDGNSVSYAYDNLNREITRTYSNAASRSV